MHCLWASDRRRLTAGVRSQASDRRRLTAVCCMVIVSTITPIVQNTGHFWNTFDIKEPTFCNIHTHSHTHTHTPDCLQASALAWYAEYEEVEPLPKFCIKQVVVHTHLHTWYCGALFFTAHFIPFFTDSSALFQSLRR